MSKLLKVFSVCAMGLVVSSIGCSEKKESQGTVTSQTAPQVETNDAPTTPPLPKL